MDAVQRQRSTESQRMKAFSDFKAAHLSVRPPTLADNKCAITSWIEERRLTKKKAHVQSCTGTFAS